MICTYHLVPFEFKIPCTAFVPKVMLAELCPLKTESQIFDS